jgi:Spy/CpxP family protein refolding chaperone
VKKEIGASDEEWKVIRPKMEKVIAAQQALNSNEFRGSGVGGMMMMGGAFAGPGGGGPGGPGGGFGGPGGPGGRMGGPPQLFGGPPQPGQILPVFLIELLKLTSEQKTQVDELQKEVDARLAKILTEDQRKQLKEMGERGPGIIGFGGPGGGPGGLGGFGGPGRGFGGPGAGPDSDRPGRNAPRGGGPDAPNGVAPKEPAPGKGPEIAAPSGNVDTAMPTNALSQAQADLKAVLKTPNRSAAQVKDKVDAVRRAREKARAELVAAQKDLMLLLTDEQQAVLVSLGLLE